MSRRKRRKRKEHGKTEPDSPQYRPAKPLQPPDPAQRNNKSHRHSGAAEAHSPVPGTLRGSGQKPALKKASARNRHRGRNTENRKIALLQGLHLRAFLIHASSQPVPHNIRIQTNHAPAPPARFSRSRGSGPARSISLSHHFLPETNENPVNPGSGSVRAGVNEFNFRPPKNFFRQFSASRYD